MAVKAKAPAKKAKLAKKPQRSVSKVKKGSSYNCEVCGLVVIVDELCGCVETCDIICCGEPMKPRKAKKVPVKATK